RMKAAFSDALKRAAVKFGVGRYLYRLPSQWVDYDPQRRQFARPPALPVSALPAREKPTKPQPAPRPAPKPAGKATTKLPHGLPANGEELRRRLSDYDARLTAQGVCEAGELVEHVMQAGIKAGYGSNLTAWSAPAIHLA